MKNYIESLFIKGMVICVVIFAPINIYAGSSKLNKTVTAFVDKTSTISLPEKAKVIDIIHKANQYWQSTNPVHGNAFWNRAAYHTGNMEAYSITDEKAYYDYSKAWSERNIWKGAKSDNKDNWKYSYGESDDYVLFGDWQICFQVYADLYNIAQDEYKIARAIEVMEYQMSTSNVDYWWWADGLYMVMPVMTKLYKITGNQQYLYKLYEYWQYANSIMYDESEGLYYRDAKYVYPAHKTSNGKKDFWARGDGWVFAGLAKVIADLPYDFEFRQAFIDRYLRMAEAIKSCQMEEGYWSRSLLDPDYASGYETSGTAFFTYGFVWGINNGYLLEKEYGNTVEKAWDYLVNIALQPSGKVGYVQPIGENAAQHEVSAETTADFGVGAFLLAASEMSKLAIGEMPKPVVRLYSAELENRQTLNLLFSKILDRESAIDINNYMIDGQQIEGAVSFDGAYNVSVNLNTPLDYGRFMVEINNLKSIKGEVIEDNCAKMLFSTVPSYEFDQRYTVIAIGSQQGNPESNVIDNNYSTRWSQQGEKQWIQIDLKDNVDITGVDVAFYSGDSRISYFDIELSNDNKTFRKILSDQHSSGKTNEMERYKFPVQNARYIRLVCNGNSANDWNSITELRANVAEHTSIIEKENEADNFYVSGTNNINDDIIVYSSLYSQEVYGIEVVDSNGIILSNHVTQAFPFNIGNIQIAGIYFMNIKVFDIVIKTIKFIVK